MRAVYAAFGIALLFILVGAVAIVVHNSGGHTGVRNVSRVIGEISAWGIFLSVLGAAVLTIAMSLRSRRERKHGYATIKTESDVPFIKQR